MSIGVWEVGLILLVVLIIFGAGKLPRVMGDVAQGIKAFRREMKEPDAAPATPNGDVPAAAGEQGPPAAAA